MFRILIVLCLAAASFGAAAQEPPAEPAPQQDLYLIVLQPGPRGEMPFDLASFGGRLEQRKGSRLAVRMTAEAAAAVEQNPRVKTVQRITLGRSERLESTRAGARVITHGNDSLTGGIYTYDGSGNISAIGPNSAGGTDQFTYDEFGRLASAKVHSGGTPYLESYGYDGAGNLTQLVKPNLTINLPAEAATNRLSSSLGVTYDAVGHLTQSPVGSYEYDQVGMMSGTSENLTYIYTASDERILVVPTPGGGLWRWTLRDLDGRKVREYQSERDEFFLWLEDDYYDGKRLVASQRETAEGGRRHYHPDHLGTPRLITNAGGQRISTHDYYPYGVEITSIHQEAARGYGREQTAQFTGHERDDMDSSTTEHSVYLDYMHARFYNPNWGRFLTVDPVLDTEKALKEPQRWNRYSYVHNNPLGATDPDGRNAVDKVKKFLDKYPPVTISLGGSISGMGGLTGGGLEFRFVADTRGNVGIKASALSRIGVGASVAANFVGGVELNSALQDGVQQSLQVTVEGGKGVGGGASVGISPDGKISLGKDTSIRYGVTAGGALTLDGVTSYTNTMNVFDQYGEKRSKEAKETPKRKPDAMPCPKKPCEK